jgi:hypothetical protein
MLGQIRKDLELGPQPSVDLGVKPAAELSVGLACDFFLLGHDLARKPRTAPARRPRRPPPRRAGRSGRSRQDRGKIGLGHDSPSLQNINSDGPIIAIRTEWSARVNPDFFF